MIRAARKYFAKYFAMNGSVISVPPICLLNGLEARRGSP
jgi:hypothetical protein